MYCKKKLFEFLYILEEISLYEYNVYVLHTELRVIELVLNN